MSTHAVPATPAVAGPSAPIKKKTFKKKLIAAAIVATLGVGAIAISSHVGETHSNWTASATQEGHAVQAGRLQLAQPGTPSYFDTSSDKAPTAIDLSTFRIVPGDQISIAQAQAVTMIGTNLKADLTAAIPGNGALTGALATPGSGVTGKVYFGQGTYDPTTFNPANALAWASLDGTGATPVVHFNQPAMNGGVAYLNDGTLTDGSTKLFSVTQIDYAPSATDNLTQSTQADLSAIVYTLTQVR